MSTAERLLLRDGRVEGCSVRDIASNATFDVRAKLTLVAAGPWADIFLEHALSRAFVAQAPAVERHPRSRATLTREFALTMATAHGHFFVLPWRGHTLLGTTDTAFTGDPDAIGCQRE